jgi:hypothetical protein
MVDENEGYAILNQVAVPVSILNEIAKHAVSVDYEYSEGGYAFRPKCDGVDSVKLISGADLIANQIAYRIKKEKK